MKCLVTGCAGFIGSHVAQRLLSMGHDVVGIDRMSDYYEPGIKRMNMRRIAGHIRCTFLEQDINEADPDSLMRGTDVVFHQAAQAGVRSSWGKEFDIYIKDNIAATQKLLEAARKYELKKFIYASSSSVYGLCALPMEESASPRPVSPYGVSKLAAENLCMLYHVAYKIPVVCLRYFTVYGPGQRPDMAFHRFFRAILTGQEVSVYGDGSQTRDFTYIADVVDANILAMHSAVEGEVFNIGGGTRMALGSVMRLIEEIAGKSMPFKREEIQKGDVSDTQASVEKALKILGFRPCTPIEQGLREEWKWVNGIYK